MKENLTPEGMQKQYDDLAKIVKVLQKEFPQFKFSHWNHADFSIHLKEIEFLTLDELMKIDQTLRNYGRGVVLIGPVLRGKLGQEEIEIEIVTVESGFPKLRLKPNESRNLRRIRK